MLLDRTAKFMCPHRRINILNTILNILNTILENCLHAKENILKLEFIEVYFYILSYLLFFFNTNGLLLTKHI